MQAQYNRLMTMYRTDVEKYKARIAELEKEVVHYKTLLDAKAAPKKEVKKK